MLSFLVDCSSAFPLFWHGVRDLYRVRRQNIAKSFSENQIQHVLSAMRIGPIRLFVKVQRDGSLCVMTCSKRVEPGVVAHFSNLTHLPRFWPNSFSLATMCPNIWPLLKKCFIAILRADWFIILCVSEKSLAIRRLILEATNRGGRLGRTSHSVNIAKLTLTNLCCWGGCWWYFPTMTRQKKFTGIFGQNWTCVNTEWLDCRTGWKLVNYISRLSTYFGTFSFVKDEFHTFPMMQECKWH